MKKEIPVEEENPSPARQQSFVDGLRRILMAGLGSVTLAQNEVEAFVSRLVERGEIGEKDARSLVGDFVDKRKKQAEETKRRMEAEVEQHIEKLLTQMNVPTKPDIDRLSQKVADLSAKLDQLTKTNQK